MSASWTSFRHLIPKGFLGMYWGLSLRRSGSPHLVLGGGGADIYPSGGVEGAVVCIVS